MVTYVCKSLGLNPRVSTLFSDFVLGFTITINNHPSEFVNVYFSNTTPIFSFLLNVVLATDFYVARDFNCYLNTWYSLATTDSADLIRNASTCSSVLTQGAESFELNL